MKTYLRGLLVAALLVISGPVFAAGCNIAQPDSGTEWRCSTPDNSALDIPVGVHHIPVLIVNVTTAKTAYIIMPLTASKVSNIQAVLQNRITGNANTFRLWNMDTNGNVVSEVTNATQSMRFTPPTTGATGLVTGKTSTFTPTGNETFTQGHVLAIQSEGGATLSGGSSDVLFIVTVRPR